MKKGTGRKGYLKRMITALSAFVLALSISITALADGEFAGNITIKGTVDGYEYKVYEVLECIAAGGDLSVFMATESWKEFLKTNENAVAMLIPKENSGDYPMADETSELYTVNMESDKAVRQAFAADVLEYAKENGIEAYESITAEGEGSTVTFEYVPLGIYVIDTAGKARITVMWDMEWETEIKESYKPEAENTSAGAEEKAETLQNIADSIEESSVEEDRETDTADAETGSGERAVEEPVTAEKEVSKADSKVPVVIVAAVVLLAVAAVLFFMKKRK